VRLELAPGTVPCVTERRLDGGVGHVRVRWFAAAADQRSDAGALARAALEGLAADGAPGVVIDVRSGLGGMLSAANAIVSALCDDDVVGADRDASGAVRTHPRMGSACWLGATVVVLVNEQTISAAEWLALALEELAGAVLVGTPTAGGMTALRFVELADGYRLALPSGAMLGPRTREPRPGYRLQPHVHAANPTAGELAAGVDPALDLALRTVQRLAAGR
jgi:C-terminal processing protease CtpA/Prc